LLRIEEASHVERQRDFEKEATVGVFGLRVERRPGRAKHFSLREPALLQLE